MGSSTEYTRRWKQAHPEKVKEHARRSYLAAKAAHPEVLQKRVRENAQRHRAWVASLKISKACVDCGLVCTQENYAAFDWDHRPGEAKCFALSRCPRDKVRVLAEIAKCDLRCKNCHAVITHRRIAGV